MRVRVKNYLSITKKEWNGMVVLLILIVFVLAAPNVYQLFCKDNTINIKDFDKQLAELRKNDKSRAQFAANNHNIVNNITFGFNTINPNHTPLFIWQQLGLKKSQAEDIQKFVDAGGVFYKKADLKKIQSIADSDYVKIEPYLNKPEEKRPVYKAAVGKIVELNGADSATLTEIRGIGPSFAKRIFRYKSRLGGFINKQQLKEIFGIDALKFSQIENQISINPSLIIKLKINSISFNQLRLFPYLNYKQANAVIEYRNQHGNYKNIDDLKNIAILNDVILRKIEPYLIFK